MCPKCSGTLVYMDYPDHTLGTKCMACGKHFWNDVPLEWKKGPDPGMNVKSEGIDKYAGRETKGRTRNG